MVEMVRFPASTVCFGCGLIDGNICLQSIHATGLLLPLLQTWNLSSLTFESCGWICEEDRELCEAAGRAFVIQNEELSIGCRSLTRAWVHDTSVVRVVCLGQTKEGAATEISIGQELSDTRNEGCALDRRARQEKI